MKWIYWKWKWKRKKKKVKNKKVFLFTIIDWLLDVYMLQNNIHTYTHKSQFQDDPKWKEMTIKNRNRKKKLRDRHQNKGFTMFVIVLSNVACTSIYIYARSKGCV